MGRAMPFDGDDLLDMQIERLAVLCELAEHKMRKNQRSWETCLWSEAKQDERLIRMGIGALESHMTQEIGFFFGIDFVTVATAIGGYPKKVKAPHIRHNLEFMKK